MGRRSRSPFGDDYAEPENVVPMYIENLDAELRGGVPKGHIILLCGPAGTMKTSLVYYILMNNAEQNGAKATFITLEQSRERIIKSMEQLGLYSEDNKVSIADMSKLRLKKDDKGGELDWLAMLRDSITDLTKEDENCIIAIDSLNALYSIHPFANPRKELFSFFRFLHSTGATFFLISEMTLDSPSFSQYAEDFLVDGIINTRFREIKEVGLQLLLICIKMREVPIHRKYYNLDFEANRFLATTVISRLE